MPADGVPPLPVALGETGSTTWMRVWQSPAKAWLSPELDVITVQTVCELVEEIEQLRRLFLAMPLLEEEALAPGGQTVSRLVVNPAEGALRRAQKQLAQELSSLGFNPTARAKLGLAEIKRRSKVEELLERSRPREEAPQGKVIDAEIVDLASDG